MANTPDLVYFKDTNHGLIKASQAYADSVGADSTEELIGKTAADLWPHEADEILTNERKVLVGEPKIHKERQPQGWGNHAGTCSPRSQSMMTVK